MCQQNRKTPPGTPMQSWAMDLAKTRIYVDHGHFLGKMLLDAHSKWIEAFVVPSTSTDATFEKLRLIFTHGLPKVLISDNGTAFSSSSSWKRTG